VAAGAVGETVVCEDIAACAGAAGVLVAAALDFDASPSPGEDANIVGCTGMERPVVMLASTVVAQCGTIPPTAEM